MRDYRNSKHYYVMAKVLASMKQLSYNVQVTLSVKSGFCCGCILSLSVLHGCNEELRVHYRAEHCLKVDTV